MRKAVRERIPELKREIETILRKLGDTGGLFDKPRKK